MKKWLVTIERDGVKDRFLVAAPDRAAAERCGVDHWLNAGGIDELLEHALVSVDRAKTRAAPDAVDVPVYRSEGLAE